MVEVEDTPQLFPMVEGEFVVMEVTTSGNDILGRGSVSIGGDEVTEFRGVGSVRDDVAGPSGAVIGGSGGVAGAEAVPAAGVVPESSGDTFWETGMRVMDPKG